MSAKSLAEQMVVVTLEMREALRDLAFSEPVATVYQPLDYAWSVHEWYLRNFANSRKKVIFLGMNPGPFGMTQTGIPFGEISAVRDWMGAQGEVTKPVIEHPKRPILGFSCTKSEVSGKRLWGLFAEKFPRANDFFRDHYVANFCPLVWMSESGANLTPDKLPATKRAEFEGICQIALEKSLEILQAPHLIGVGDFAQKKLALAAEHLGLPRESVGKILHPSPASPAANRGWAEQAQRQLVEQGLW